MQLIPNSLAFWRTKKTCPDLICIGSQKAGTRSLFDMLRQHEDVTLPPIKEVRYFTPWSEGRGRLMQKFTRKMRAARSRDNFNNVQRMWLQIAKRQYANGTQKAENYKQLWEHFGDAFTADITPSYAVLNKQTIDEVASVCPDSKFLFIVREPVSRLWSQAQMVDRRQMGDEGKLFEPEAFQKFLDSGVVKSRTRQSRTVKNWSAVFGDRFKCMFFDDLVRDPAAFYQEVLDFVELSKDPAKIDLTQDYNRKARRAKIEMPNELRALAIEHVGDEFEEMSNLLGGPATKWREKATKPLQQ